MGSWSEAIGSLRSSSAARGFRRWVRDVVEAVHSGDGKGLRMLRTTNAFIDGWGTDPNEGILYRTRRFGLGNVHRMVDLKVTFDLRDPVLAAPRHLVFLNRLFRASLESGSPHGSLGFTNKE